MSQVFRLFRPALVILLGLTALLGGVYPALVTVIAQAVFPHQANGSLIMKEDKPVGSELIGQQFSKPEYLWGRLSATGGAPYNAAISSGSNLGPNNKALLDAVKARIKALKSADPENTKPIPVDLVTASGSGLDPHISLAAAEYQMDRVVSARKMQREEVAAIVRQHTQPRLFGLLGEQVVNVLLVNRALDKFTPR